MGKSLAVLLFSVIIFLFQAGAALAEPQIKINKTTNQLQFQRDGTIIKTFPVATGKLPSYTPEGTFTVVTKLVNPYYSKLGIPGGSPQNPLGARWLGLDIGGGGIYGIHGTNNPASIGTYASAGCIRMYNKDVIWLYDHTSPGTLVRIISTPAAPQAAPQTRPVVIAAEGRRVTVDTPGLSDGDYSPLLPLRTVFELLGYTVRWDGAASSVHLSSNAKKISVSCADGMVTTANRAFKLAGITTVPGAVHGPLSLWRHMLPAHQISWDPVTGVVTFIRQTGAAPLPGPTSPPPGTPDRSPGGSVPGVLKPGGPGDTGP